MANSYDASIIHFHPHLCLDIPFDGTYGTLTRASTNINDVTCKYCSYYYFNPEARRLEIEFRQKTQINN